MALTLHAVGLAAAVVYGIAGSWRAAIVGYVVVLSSEVVMAYISRPLELAISARLGLRSATIAVVAGVCAAFWSGAAHGIILLAGTALIVRVARSFSYQRTGALTPVSLALSGLVIEAFTLSYMQKVSFFLG